MNKSKNRNNKKVSKNRKPIMNRLQKYSQVSQSLAVVTGVLGQTAICSASITALDVGSLTNGATVNGYGTGSLGTNVLLPIDQSSDPNDTLRVLTSGTNGSRVIFQGFGSFSTLTMAYDYGIFAQSPPLHYFAPLSIVSSSNSFRRSGYLASYTPEQNLGSWTVDRPNGAIGFKNGDGEFGYINVSWVAATKTLTFLGTGFFDDEPGTSITIAAIPEPSEYAAVLGLGALGLAYYRRRPGNKTRAKE